MNSSNKNNHNISTSTATKSTTTATTATTIAVSCSIIVFDCSKARTRGAVREPPGVVIWTCLRKGVYRFLTRFFEPFKSLLRPSWNRFLIDFWKVLGVENDANKDLNKNVKIVFSPRRKSKNGGSEASQKPSKIDEETCSQTCSEIWAT